MNKNNGQKPNIGQAAVPIIQAMADVKCWCCERGMRVPAEMLKQVERVVCQICAKDFDAFMWSFYKSARDQKIAMTQAKIALENEAKKVDNNIEGGNNQASDPVEKIK
jgi:hypothetical protein